MRIQDISVNGNIVSDGFVIFAENGEMVASKKVISVEARNKKTLINTICINKIKLKENNEF